MKSVRAIWPLFLAFILITTPANAATWHVPDDFPTIAEALDAAEAGDFVVVACGTYYEHNLAMKSGVYLRSETDDPYCVTIDGESFYRIMVCDGVSAATRIRGITFANGFDTNAGGAILIMNGSQPSIVQCRFKNNTAYIAGGAIRIYTYSTADIQECEFSNNSVTNSESPFGGGAIFCDFQTNLEASDCHFMGNSSNEYGGAVLGLDSDSIFLENCTFEGNYANDSGGAVSCQAGLLTITDCALVDNTAGYTAGAVYSYFCSSLSVTRCTIVGNETSLQIYGQVFLVGTPATIEQSIVAFNSGAAAVACGAGGSVDLACCDLYGNSGGDYDEDCVDGQLGINGNISEDPLFCDLEARELTLRGDSPCVNEPGCGVMGALGTGCVFTITAVTDVDNDQGRNVRLRWDRSRYDADSTAYTIMYYGVWRRIDGSGVKGDDGEGQDGENRQLQLLGLPTGQWDAVGTVPAIGEADYSMVAPTLCDSTASGICWSVFAVTAHTPEPLVYFTTAPDSGYSVDNLVPAVPSGLMLVEPGAIAWDPSAADDLAYYSVYSDDEPEGPHTDAVLVGHATVTSYDLPVATEGTYIFVTASDFAGNESAYSNSVLNPVISATGGVPSNFHLAQNHPNPFNPATVIRYSLPQEARVSLRIYDVNGGLVRLLVADRMTAAGVHEAFWNGRDESDRAVSAGIYFYCLRAGEYQSTRRMALIR